MQIIDIRCKLPSLNEYVAECKKDYRAAGRMVKQHEQLIMVQLSKMRKVKSPIHIHFQWHEKSRRRDKDNVAFGKKFILDAMQYAGKLPNDNNRYIAGFSDGFDYGKAQGVTLMIKEEDNEL